MNELLNAIKADLLDRRLRAGALLLAVALLAAVAYAVSGGGSSSPGASAPALSSPSGTGAGSISPVAAPNPNQASAETPAGSSKQRRGGTRNPFTPLPGSASLLTSASSKGSGLPAAKAGTETTRSSGGTTPASSAPKAPAAPRTTYAVSAAMGQLLPGAPAQSAQLTPHENLKFQEKLPSPSLRLLAFNGVTSGGKKATFKLIGEVIPRSGLARCSPSPTQCQTIELEANQDEELEYLPPSGPTQVYQLRVLSITAP